MITLVIIGASLLAIFGRMPWPALFSLGVVVAAPGYGYIGRDRCGNVRRNQTLGCCSSGWVITTKDKCTRPGKDPSEDWQ